MNSITKFLDDKDNHFLQFVKYGFCGGAAFAVDFSVFCLLATFVFHAWTPDDVFVKLFSLDVEPITEAVRLRNFWIGKTCSFMCANIVAYILNIKFVFKAGKHKRHQEVILFFTVSFIAFVLGTWSGDALIRFFGIQTTISNFTAIFSAVMINYVGRKFFIFNG